MRLMAETPFELFLMALREMRTEESLSAAVWAEDDEFYYINPYTAWDAVREHFEQKDIFFPSRCANDFTKLNRNLASAGYIKLFPTKARTLYTANIYGKKCLWIYRWVIDPTEKSTKTKGDGDMSSGKQMTNADRDLVIKLVFGARKMTTLDVVKAFDNQYSDETVRRVVKAYKLVEEDNEAALIHNIAKNILSRKTVEWAYDYWAKEIPEDFFPRVDALIKGNCFEEKKEEPTPNTGDSVEDQNLLALLGKLNSLGTTLCECVTADQAKVFTKIITDSINASTEALLNELRKQTEFLESISNSLR